MRILVTGGAGFIGSFVVDQLVEAGHDVVVIDNLDPAAHRGPPDYLQADVEYIASDVRDPEAWEAAQPVDAIAHLAGKVGLGVDFRDAPGYVSNNDVGTVTGLTALHDLDWRGRFVLASSMVVYGEGRYECATHGDVIPAPRLIAELEAGNFEPPCPECGEPVKALPIDEDRPCRPRNVYAATKLHQEHLCEAWGATHESPVTSLRFHNVYGPRMPQLTPYAGVASIFASELKNGRAPKVFEDGAQRRDFVHVRDVAAVVVAALTHPVAYDGPLNVASGDPRTVHDMAACLADAIDPALRPEVVGGWREGDVRHVFASPARAQEALEVVPQVTFEAGVTELASAQLREPPLV